MEYKLFGVWVVSKGAEKTFFNLVMIQMMRTFHIPIDLNLIDEALAKATTMALTKWAPWLHDIIYKKTILKWLVQDVKMLWYDWCVIHTPMQRSDWCEQHTTLHANTEIFFFLQKKKRLKKRLNNQKQIDKS